MRRVRVKLFPINTNWMNNWNSLFFAVRKECLESAWNDGSLFVYTLQTHSKMASIKIVMDVSNRIALSEVSECCSFRLLLSVDFVYFKWNWLHERKAKAGWRGNWRGKQIYLPVYKFPINFQQKTGVCVYQFDAEKWHRFFFLISMGIVRSVRMCARVSTVYVSCCLLFILSWDPKIEINVCRLQMDWLCDVDEKDDDRPAEGGWMDGYCLCVFAVECVDCGIWKFENANKQKRSLNRLLDSHLHFM